MVDEIAPWICRPFETTAHTETVDLDRSKAMDPRASSKKLPSPTGNEGVSETANKPCKNLYDPRPFGYLEIPSNYQDKRTPGGNPAEVTANASGTSDPDQVRSNADASRVTPAFTNDRGKISNSSKHLAAAIRSPLSELLPREFKEKVEELGGEPYDTRPFGHLEILSGYWDMIASQRDALSYASVRPLNTSGREPESLDHAVTQKPSTFISAPKIEDARNPFLSWSGYTMRMNSKISVSDCEPKQISSCWTTEPFGRWDAARENMLRLDATMTGEGAQLGLKHYGSHEVGSTGNDRTPRGTPGSKITGSPFDSTSPSSRMISMPPGLFEKRYDATTPFQVIKYWENGNTSATKINKTSINQYAQPHVLAEIKQELSKFPSERCKPIRRQKLCYGTLWHEGFAAYLKKVEETYPTLLRAPRLDKVSIYAKK